MPGKEAPGVAVPTARVERAAEQPRHRRAPACRPRRLGGRRPRSRARAGGRPRHRRPRGWIPASSRTRPGLVGTWVTSECVTDSQPPPRAAASGGARRRMPWKSRFPRPRAGSTLGSCPSSAVHAARPATASARSRAGSRAAAAASKLLPWLVAADAASFDEEATASVPVVVDLWAPWCVPCQMIAPALERPRRRPRRRGQGGQGQHRRGSRSSAPASTRGRSRCWSYCATATRSTGSPARSRAKRSSRGSRRCSPDVTIRGNPVRAAGFAGCREPRVRTGSRPWSDILAILLLASCSRSRSRRRRAPLPGRHRRSPTPTTGPSRTT